jgi:hypothetical protein
MSLHIRAASQNQRLALYLNSWNKLVGKQLLFPFICNTHRPRNHWEIMRLLIQLRALCEVRQYLYLVEGVAVRCLVTFFSGPLLPAFSIKGLLAP